MVYVMEQIITQSNKFKIFSILISFLIGTLLGSGAIFSFYQKEREDKNLELSKIKESVTLMQKKDEVYDRVSSLNNEYSQDKKNNNLDSSKIEYYKNRFSFLAQNFYVYEQKLALIEGRAPKVFFMQSPISGLIPKPSIPTGVSLRRVESNSFLFNYWSIQSWFLLSLISFSALFPLTIIIILLKKSKRFRSLFILENFN